MIHDRGLLKWLPFKSLPEQEDYLNKISKQQDDVEKPELSPDQQEEINNTLMLLEPGEKIKVTFFSHKRIIDRIVNFITVDAIGKILSTSAGSIPLSEVLSIQSEEVTQLS